ncbi:MAG: fused MFS/spermidine synthase [Promicromonosporaceae bacterium]|nr:fused MFS/spermidine synthase [Promicromonosporaceae bacterium]
MPKGLVPIDTGEARLEFSPPHGVTLFVNGAPSSYVDLEAPDFLAFEYFQQMNAIVETTHNGPIKALHLGAGGCSLPRAWDFTRPGSGQIAVDTDGRLLELVREWFGLPRAPALRLRTQDAAQAVAEAKSESFDIVVRDVFAPDVTPPELTTAEFAAQVARILKPDGVYLANCADRPPLANARREVANLLTAFRWVAVAAEVGVLAKKRFGNLVLAASNSDANPFDSPQLARTLRSLPVPARVIAGKEIGG